MPNPSTRQIIEWKWFCPHSSALCEQCKDHIDEIMDSVDVDIAEAVAKQTKPNPPQQLQPTREWLEAHGIQIDGGVDGTGIQRGSIDVALLMESVAAERAEATKEAQTGRVLEWLEGEDALEVARFLGIIVYQYIMKPTNATKFSTNIDGMTFQGEPIGDIKLSAALSSQKGKKYE